MKNFLKDAKNILKSCILCIQYPFLYPRNRFSGKHYNNYTIDNYLYGHLTNSYYNTDEQGNRILVPSKKIPGIYDKAWEDEFIHLKESDENGSTIKHIKHTKNYLYASWFYVIMFVYNFIIRPLHCIPTYTEWDAVETGWKKAFGDQYLKELKAQLKKDKCLYSWRILDIKEKYGTFRLYCNYGSKELFEIINKYENLSYNTCIRCGKPATKISGGWISPYCDDCFDKDNLAYFIKDKDNNWIENPEFIDFQKQLSNNNTIKNSTKKKTTKTKNKKKKDGETIG